MNLKESFRYQNYLNKLFGAASSYLSSNGYMTVVKQTHLRKKVNQDAEDEEQIVSTERPYDCKDNNVIIDFFMDVVREKDELSAAISSAKKSLSFDLDAEIASNKYRQMAASTLQRVADLKSSDRITRGAGYKFNAEGNQVAYQYDVKEVTTIDFDRNKVKYMVRKLLEQSDNASTEADKCMVSVEIDFEPKYNLQDSVDDAIMSFVHRQDDIARKINEDNRHAV